MAYQYSTPCYQPFFWWFKFTLYFGFYVIKLAKMRFYGGFRGTLIFHRFYTICENITAGVTILQKIWGGGYVILLFSLILTDVTDFDPKSDDVIIYLNLF